MISPASVQEVITRADVVEIVGQFVRLKKRGANYIGNCPFHHEKTPSFSVSASKGIYKCFGCGKGGNSVTFIQEHEKLTFPESIRWLADFYKITLEETERTPEQAIHQQVEESLRILNEFATTYFQEALKSEEGEAIGHSYFKQRGLRQETIDKFRLGYCPESGDAFYKEANSKGYNGELLEKAGLVKARNGSHYDSYRGRVIFPIQNMTGRVLGFGARLLKNNDKAPKYVNSPENELYNKSRVLYGMFQARQAIAKQDECFLTEGYLDVISLHQAGIENAVASSGTSLTEEQLRVIGQLTKSLTILYDGDAAGIKAALRGMDMALAQSFNVKIVLLPDGEDPDSYVQKNGTAAFLDYVKENKQDVVSFRLHLGLRDAGDDPVLRSKLVNELAETIARINKAEDFSLQQHYIHQASTRMGVDEAGFINLVNKYIRDRADADNRHQQRQQAALPDPVHQETGEEQHGGEPTGASVQEQQEWQLIRILLEYGDKPYPAFGSVGHYIYERIDAGLIETAVARQIFDEYFTQLGTTSTPPALTYFTAHPQPAIQQRTVTLLQHSHEISHNWKEKHGIELKQGPEDYAHDVDSTLTYFELKKIIVIQEKLREKAKDEKDPERLKKIMTALLDQMKEEREIVAKHGTVVLRSLRGGSFKL